MIYSFASIENNLLRVHKEDDVQHPFNHFLGFFSGTHTKLYRLWSGTEGTEHV